jgi:hypothetical protein
MSDLIERLRGWLEVERHLFGSNDRSKDVAEAADELERLTAKRDALARALQGGELCTGRMSGDPQRYVPECEMLRAERDALREDAERLRIRGAAYEVAYGIAYQATYQSHNGHWDSTMQGGLGCRECIKAREARENCDAALREGLERLVERAAKDTAKTSEELQAEYMKKHGA